MYRNALAALFFCLTLGVPATAASDTSETREISGEMMVLERMALPDDTVLLVDLTDAQDNSVASHREGTDGRQSPFAFSLTAPTDELLVLRVGLRGGDDAFWLSEPVAIAEGDEDVSLGTLRALRIPFMGFASLLSCDNQYFELGFRPDEVRLRLNEQIITMLAEPAASGEMFVSADNPSTSVHLKDASAILRIDGAELSECALIRPQDDITLGIWTISSIQGTPTLFPSRTELVFYPDGRISASIGCNRMVGSYRRHGGVLTFGRIASTLMACPEGLDDQERRFASVLDVIDGYRLDPESGRLNLLAGGETILQARK